MTGLPPNDDDVEPSDWLAEQFKTEDVDSEAEVDPDAEADRAGAWPEQTRTAPTPRTPPAETPLLVNPLAAPPSTFVWGLKPSAVTEPVSATDVDGEAETPGAAEAPAPVVEPIEPPPATVIIDPVVIDPVAMDPLDFALNGVPSPESEPPTVALPWETGSNSPESAVFTAAESSVPVEPAVSADSPIDSLFGASEFKEYENEPIIGSVPFLATRSPAAGTSAARTSAAGAPRTSKRPVARVSAASLTKQQKTLFSVIGGVLAALILVVLFALGTKLPEMLGPSPVVAISHSATPKPTPSPTPATPVAGPVALGEHKWDELRGAECLSPFTSPWEEKFTVVDCAAPHPAQMVSRGEFPPTAAAPAASTGTATPTPAPSADGYPGIPALQAQINLLCGSPSVINFGAAGAYDDIQFQAAYAVTEKEWASGYHDYFCFVSRTSGESITGSIATAPAG